VDTSASRPLLVALRLLQSYAAPAVARLAGTRLLRMEVDMAAVASQANVGGGTSALALARSLGRDDLVPPAVLIASLGSAIGTFAGFWVVRLL